MKILKYLYWLIYADLCTVESYFNHKVNKHLFKENFNTMRFYLWMRHKMNVLLARKLPHTKYPLERIGWKEYSYRYEFMKQWNLGKLKKDDLDGWNDRIDNYEYKGIFK